MTMKIAVSGFDGRMGKVLREAIAEEPALELVFGFDVKGGADGDVPVYTPETMDAAGKADVVIDFSNYAFIPHLMRWCAERKTPVVVATTALGDQEREILKNAAKEIPVFHSANMSIGINLIAKMSGLAMPPLEDSFNVEIIEKHHSKKADSPSGTAILLADAVNEACKNRKEYIYGRHSKNDEPGLSEIGIHAVRGGTLPGQHTVMFAGPDEVIEITHTVYSRRVFATGALAAAKFIAGRGAGLYSMNDML